jgi:hypothetical protein
MTEATAFYMELVKCRIRLLSVDKAGRKAPNRVFLLGFSVDIPALIHLGILRSLA